MQPRASPLQMQRPIYDDTASTARGNQIRPESHKQSVRTPGNKPRLAGDPFLQLVCVILLFTSRSGLSSTNGRNAFFTEPEASACAGASAGPRRMMRNAKTRKAVMKTP